MYLGRIVEIGPTEDVLLRPRHPYTKAFDVVQAGGIDRPILQGEPPDPTRIPAGCRFHPRCPVVASGRAASLGIESRCRGEDLALEELAPDHLAACYEASLDPEGSRFLGRRRRRAHRPRRQLRRSRRRGLLRRRPDPVPWTPRIASISESGSFWSGCIPVARGRSRVGWTRPSRRGSPAHERARPASAHAAPPRCAAPGSPALPRARSSAGRGGGRPPDPARPVDRCVVRRGPSTRGPCVVPVPAPPSACRERGGPFDRLTLAGGHRPGGGRAAGRLRRLRATNAALPAIDNGSGNPSSLPISAGVASSGPPSPSVVRLRRGMH